MKYLITGSSGHLGEALVRHLQNLQLNDSSIEIISIDILPSIYTTNVGSITDENFINNIMNNVDVIFHCATLHKPHVKTHSKQDFINVNVTGTLILLEASIKAKVKVFIYTSTTSVFGDALEPVNIDDPAVWINEDSEYICKNIYGVTKLSAEHLLQLFHRDNKHLHCTVLRTSRFFPEDDDTFTGYNMYNDKANEYLFRRVEIQDIVDAHLLAVTRAFNDKSHLFRKYIISATTPFQPNDIYNLRINAIDVVLKYYPHFKEIYDKINWKMYPKISRVYDNKRAREELNWNPKYNFEYILNVIKEQILLNNIDNIDISSPLAKEIGIKLYHR